MIWFKRNLAYHSNKPPLNSYIYDLIYTIRLFLQRLIISLSGSSGKASLMLVKVICLCLLGIRNKILPKILPTNLIALRGNPDKINKKDHHSPPDLSYPVGVRFTT